MKLSSYKKVELNGSSYVKIPLTSCASINFKTDDEYCLIWSFLAHLYPRENDILIEYQGMDNLLMN